MPITINGSGTITGISAGGLPDNCVTAADLATTLDLSSNTVTLPSGTGGKILQVVSTQYETPNSVSHGAVTHVDLPFSVNITPTTSTSLMLVSFSIEGEVGNLPWGSMAAFSRTISGTRTVVLPTTSYGSRLPGIVSWADTFGPTDNDSSPGGFYLHMFPDSNRPANTSQITYTPTMACSIAATFYINRNVGDSVDGVNSERGISWITVMEVAA